jgi:chromosome segregation ATPase
MIDINSNLNLISIFLVMGCYQKSRPSKKAQAKHSKIIKERHQKYIQRQQQQQEETIETLASGVEELVVKLEEKEKELNEVMEHEIELSENMMSLEGVSEGLKKDVGRERRWAEVREQVIREERLKVTEMEKEIKKLKWDSRISIKNRDDYIKTLQESIRGLRVQVEEKNRELENLRGRLQGQGRRG